MQQEELKVLCFAIEEAARMGDVFELRKHIATLADLIGENDKKVKHLKQLVESFSMDAVREYSQKLTQKTSEAPSRD